jgi:UDP-perosamine 4-acetyltransferase
MKEEIILVGSGGHAKIVNDILNEMNGYEIRGVVTNEKLDSFCGLPVLGNDEVLDTYFSRGIRKLAMGIGGFTSNSLREQVYLSLRAKQFEFINCIHPSAIISKSCKIGDGCVIFAGTVLNAEVVIGNNVIVATGSTIDHETQLGDHILVSAGVTIGANNKISTGALIALGAKIVSGVTIGENSLVAAGSVVVNDVPANTAVFGIPAKPKA